MPAWGLPAALSEIKRPHLALRVPPACDWLKVRRTNFLCQNVKAEGRSLQVVVHRAEICGEDATWGSTRGGTALRNG